MDTPNSEQQFRILLRDIIGRNPLPELSAAEIKFYSMIGDSLEQVGDWVVWLN